MSGSPLQIRYGGDKWKHVIGSEAIINIKAYPSTDLSWLTVTDSRKVKVEITKDGFDYWTGFAIPNQNFLSLNYVQELTFVANDQLGLLGNFEYVDSSGYPYDGFLNCLDVFARVLDKTGLELNLVSAVNLFEDDMNYTDSDDPLAQAEILQDIIQDENLNPGSCYQMLLIILKTFQARMFQSEGKWWVVRVKEYAGGGLVDNREYTFDNINIEYDYSSNGTFTTEITTNNSTFRLLRDASIETVEPWQQLTIVRNHNKKQNIVKAGTFPTNEFTSDTDLRHWTIEASSGFERYEYDDKCMIRCNSIGSVYDYAKYIESDGIYLESVFTQSFTLQLKWGAFGSLGVRKCLQILLDDGAGTVYYYSGSSWGTTSTTIVNIEPPLITAPREVQETELTLTNPPARS
jgi:hypothetical protein